MGGKKEVMRERREEGMDERSGVWRREVKWEEK